jgi:hypothetical protein
MIVWKTPALRFADMGFISDDGRRLYIEVYSSGSALMKLTLEGSRVCMERKGCMGKSQFNRSYLSAAYPERFLENLFRGKPIFAGQGLVKKRHGFTQTIEKRGQYAIDYRVFNNDILFRDTINHIVIKVKR